MVARGVKEKGWHELVAAARMIQSMTPIRVVLVGDGPAIAELRNQCSEPWIVVVGQQSDPSGWIASFDVGVLPSYLPEESLPNSIIEYLAYKKPVIATAVGGIPEMIGHSGRLIPLDASGRADVRLLADAMLELTQPQVRAMFDTERDYQRYDMDHCVKAYEDLFAQLVCK
jgi:glycosyltransferase involved in cell wall biosynthesis